MLSFAHHDDADTQTQWDSVVFWHAVCWYCGGASEVTRTMAARARGRCLHYTGRSKMLEVGRSLVKGLPSRGKADVAVASWPLMTG